MERAYLRSDASYDGLFFLGVRTTGIFCRPSCRGRKPKPENVDFFGEPAEAVRAGFRPCRRCTPAARRDEPAWVQPLLDRVETNPDARVSERQLQKMSLDPDRVRRYFLTRFGLTFQGYCRARRLAGAYSDLRSGGALDDAVFGHGYESHSGFREAFAKVFGQPPARAAAKGGAQAPLHVNWIDTPIGPLLAGATDEGVCLLEFSERHRLERQVQTLQRLFRTVLVPGPHRHLTQLERELGEYFESRRQSFDVALAMAGTPFELQVWRALQRIPFGETRSYEDVARAVGNVRAVRAVGRANGRNHIVIVIPCHRVVNKSGDLGGYGGGLWRKRRLLHLEQSGPVGALTRRAASTPRA
jgi:AraC family transcriptional regulator of adaptative response/methylated-DNA-[protein]-cysteine methyltransferase